MNLLFHLGCLPFFYSLNLNYTWTKDEYTFDYYVGVCVVPLSTPLSGCYVIQKTTTPDGVASFACVGKDLDVQVTDTKGTCLWSPLSFHYDVYYVLKYTHPADSLLKHRKIHINCLKYMNPFGILYSLTDWVS